jgi:hypothetical protein
MQVYFEFRSLKATKIIAQGETLGLNASKTATLKASNISTLLLLAFSEVLLRRRYQMFELLSVAQ